MTNLLTPVGNPKTAKGREKGYAVVVCHLSPAKSSGHQVCAGATAECIELCLTFAGRGGIFVAGADTNAIQEARKWRTRLLFTDRAVFAATLKIELVRFFKWCHANGFIPAVRLNGTSDLNWEAMLKGAGLDLMALYAEWSAIPYDYTKIATYLHKRPGVHLTLSYTGYNTDQCIEWLKAGRNVAVVFKKGLPETFLGFPVINADEDDLRFLDPPGTVCGLKAKGRARKAVNNVFVVGS